MRQLTSNTVDRRTLGTSSNLVAVGRERPEALGAVDIGVDQAAGVLGLINEAKVIGTRSVVLESHSEQRRVQLGLNSVEESGLRFRADSVDRAESQTQKTIVVLVLHELSADLAGSLDGLGSGLDTTDGNGVFVDITASRATIAVGNRPAGT